MSESHFRDLFSDHAAEYARFRPSYPAELFAFLTSLPRSHELAWDCATGNGQAAIPLARHFEHVIATDASAEQISHAPNNPQVTYRVTTADASGIDDVSVDLVCCAQAAHWLDLDAFYREVRRVTRTGGAVALVTYVMPMVSSDIDPYLNAYANSIVGAFWPPERRHVDSGYTTLPFPFKEVVAPPLRMTAEWTAEDMLAYLGTWSATRGYIRHLGADPRDAIAPDLTTRWGKDRRTVEWPMSVRAGIIV